MAHPKQVTMMGSTSVMTTKGITLLDPAEPKPTMFLLEHIFLEERKGSLPFFYERRTKICR